MSSTSRIALHSVKIYCESRPAGDMGAGVLLARDEAGRANGRNHAPDHEGGGKGDDVVG